ncbi:hypothetical protein [Prevotella sp. P2-180]|uniref:hypothetical protein n=1 Tax=Prevotella sp. P2-180 TaxID=2024224 RepID=UPI000B97357C|nr:hypothetical protein [Prevotella sp. P2-180]OYP66997.1 hypothetical protein CIK98_06260 [Prevotella sp. P2-180]
MPIDEWHNLHNLKVSLENTISSCSDSAFGSDVRLEIQTILENTEKKIQRILDKNFSVKPKDFDKYHIITWDKDCGEDDKDDCRTLAEAKKLAKSYFGNGYEEVTIFKDHCRVWVINELHNKGYDPRK